jgi:hypothetical protein
MRAEHHQYLRRHLPALREDHEDLMSDTLVALSTHVSEHAHDLPASWFETISPANKEERSHFYKLGMLILKRRIADLFRRRSSRPLFAIEEAAVNVVDPQPIPDRKIMIRKLLEVTSSLLDEMRTEDRDLVALVSREPGFRQKLTPRERKRLQRVREKLRTRIAEQLGDNVAELLRVD